MRRFLSYWATAAVLALATVMVSSSASAGLCASCAGKVFVTSVGKCTGCGKATTSSSFTLGPACSAARNQCEACGAALCVVVPVVAPVIQPVVPPVVVPVIPPVVPPVVAPVVPQVVKPVVPRVVAPTPAVRSTAVAPAAPAVK